MSATTSKTDKFAFLFRTDNTYDLSSVKTTFNTFYGYPDTVGTVNHVVEVTGCSLFLSKYMAFVQDILSYGSAVGNVPSIETASITVMVYILGDADINGLKTTATDVLSWTDLRKALRGQFPNPSGPFPITIVYQGSSELNVILDTPSNDAFVIEWNTNTPVDNGTLLTAGTLTNLKTKWTDLMQLKTAGLLNTGGMLGMSVVAGHIFTNPTDLTNYFKLVGSGADYFAGRPEFLINDGNPIIEESLDISLGHPLDPGYDTPSYNTSYLQDSGTFRNTIKVNVKNTGTHVLDQFRVDIGLYNSLLSVPVSPVKTGFGVKVALLKPDVTDTISVSSISFMSSDYIVTVAVASYSGDSLFSDADIAGNSNEARRTISFLLEPLYCVSSHVNVSANGLSDGSVTITITGGIAPYFYILNGAAPVQDNNNTHTFPGLPVGPYTITVTDSSVPSRNCSKTETIDNPGVVQGCVTRLDNLYLNICKAITGELRYTFKAFPLSTNRLTTRVYKIRWKVTGLNPRLPVTMPNWVQLRNITVTSTGLETISGIHYAYAILNVPSLLKGSMILHHPRLSWPFGHNRIEVPTEIFIRKFRPFFPPYTFISIAKYRLVITSNSIDVLVP